MATIPGVGPTGGGSPEPRPDVRPAAPEQRPPDQLREYTEREPTQPTSPPPPPQDTVEISTREAAPPPPPPPPPETEPPADTSPTASEAASGSAQTTANYNEQNPTSPVAEQEIGGTVNVKI